MRSGVAERGRDDAVDSDVEWLGRHRTVPGLERSVNPTAATGLRVEVRAPQRGDKRALLEMGHHNAGEEFARHRLRRASDHNARARADTSLQDTLGLPEAPLRIECYDMSLDTSRAPTTWDRWW